MSLWCSLSGRVTFTQKDHVSLRKLIEPLLGNAEFILNDNTSFTQQFVDHDVGLSVCIDGDEGFEVLRAVKSLLEKKCCSMDITIEIRCVK